MGRKKATDQENDKKGYEFLYWKEKEQELIQRAQEREKELRTKWSCIRGGMLCLITN